MQTHGVNLRSDDWGDTGSPSALGQALKYEETGVLEDAADKDVFTIDRTCTTPLHVRAAGIGAGQTADLQVRVLDATGTAVLGSDNPDASHNDTTYPRVPDGVDADVSLASTPLGLIRIEVDGVGFGDPLSGGYSDYGSVGRYTLSITGCGGIVGSAPGVTEGVHASQPYRTGNLNVQWGEPANVGDGPVLGYRVTGLPSGTVDFPASQHFELFTGLNPGQLYKFGVSAINAYGAGQTSWMTYELATWMPNGKPTLKATAKNQTVTLDWTEPANPGRAAGSFWTVNMYYDYDLVGSFESDYKYSGLRITSVNSGHYKLTAFLTYTIGCCYTKGTTGTTYVDVGPSAPRIGTASSGASGGTKTVTVRWAAPSVLRGSTITSYYVIGYRLDSSNHVVAKGATSALRASKRSYTWTLPSGRYRFKVQAHSTAGWSPVSGFSNIVYSR
jgi:hypothetical protein